MTAKANGKIWFNLGAEASNPGSKAAQMFWDTHGAWFTEGANTVSLLSATGDGDNLLLFEAALLGLAQRIRDHLSQAGVVVTSQAE